MRQKMQQWSLALPCPAIRIKELGRLNYFLEIEVSDIKYGIFISQHMCKTFWRRWVGSKPSKLTDLHHKLGEARGGPSMDGEGTEDQFEGWFI